METEPQVTSVEEKNARNQAIKDSLWGSNTSGPSGASSSAAGEGTSGSSQPKSGPSRMEEDEDEGLFLRDEHLTLNNPDISVIRESPDSQIIWILEFQTILVYMSLLLELLYCKSG